MSISEILLQWLVWNLNSINLIAYKSVSAGSLITWLQVKRFTYKLRLFLVFQRFENWVNPYSYSLSKLAYVLISDEVIFDPWRTCSTLYYQNSSKKFVKFVEKNSSKNFVEKNSSKKNSSKNLRWKKFVEAVRVWIDSIFKPLKD